MANAVQTSPPGDVGRGAPGPRPAAGHTRTFLGQCRAQLEAAEATLHAAFDEAAKAASAIREVEAALRHAWEASHAGPVPPAFQRTLERLREERAAWTYRKHEAHRAAEEAGLQVASARRALEAAEDRARRLRRQLVHEADTMQTLRRAIAATEQRLSRQREALREKEALIGSINEEIMRLAGE